MKKRFGNYLSDVIRPPQPVSGLPIHVIKQIDELRAESPWSRHLREQRQRRELVVGGEVLWKPVDLTARRVIAPAPWWAKSPPSSARPAEPRNPPNQNHMRERAITNTNPEQSAEQRLEKIKQLTGSPSKSSESNAIPGIDEQGRLDRRIEEIIDYHLGLLPQIDVEVLATIKALQATRNALDSTFSGIDESFLATLKAIRETRQAIDREIAQIRHSLGGLRRMLADDSFESARLKDFVALGENIERLRASGTFDIISKLKS